MQDVLQAPSQKYLKTKFQIMKGKMCEKRSTESTTITPEDCEDRGGTWLKEKSVPLIQIDSEEETERPEEELSGQKKD